LSRQQVINYGITNGSVTDAKLASPLAGQISFGTAGTGPNNQLYVSTAGVASSASQVAIAVQPVFSANATTQGIGIYVALGTAAASFTVPTTYGVIVAGNALGAGSAITNAYGLYVGNQGAAGVANAYGAFIATQSGASGNNFGLVLGSLNERIRNPANLAASLSIESADGHAFLSGASSAQIVYNGYYDGGNWQRFNTANTFCHLSVSASGLIFYEAAAGANPVGGAEATRFLLDNAGNVTLYGSLTGLAASFTGAVNITGGGNGPTTNDWFRCSTSGQGLYNSATGRGVGVNTRGAYDYGGSPGGQYWADGSAGAIKYLGCYVAAPTWSTTTTNWNTTPLVITATARALGGDVIIWDVWVNVAHTVASCGMYLGVGVDGGVSHYIYHTLPPTANTTAGFGFSTAFAVGAGSHNFNVYVYPTSAGTLTIYTGAHSTLRVLEYRNAMP